VPPTLDEQHRYWESIAERRTPDHPAVHAFAEPKIAYVRRAVDPDARTLLEIGAGNGYLSVPLARVFDLTCLDFSPNMLQKNPLPADRKVQGQAEALPFEAERFDVVFCANLLHHVERPLDVVREMRRVARRHVVLLEPNAKNPLMFLFGAIKKSERGALKFNADYLAKLGRSAQLTFRNSSVQGFVVPNRTPRFALPLLTRLEREHSLGLYCVVVFDK
jgi:ubiquinone/menaquinone biosynthesis C-methylase UbiE